MFLPVSSVLHVNIACLSFLHVYTLLGLYIKRILQLMFVHIRRAPVYMLYVTLVLPVLSRAVTGHN